MKDNKNTKYSRAKKKVDDIKGFYSHLTVYLIVNIAIIAVRIGVFNEGWMDNVPHWTIFTTPFFWGIGLFFHGLWVFSDNFTFFKNWEDRKIREFMKEEEEEHNNIQF